MMHLSPHPPHLSLLQVAEALRYPFHLSSLRVAGPLRWT